MSQASDGLRLRGQSEPLTRRLKRLLDEYSDGLAVPKELLQNADDAGATEVVLMYDSRENEVWRDADSLLDPAMACCQGRALWAYNNATFSDEDFDNILQLSGATKLQQTAKVGRFGLGFNSVYNLTDVPHILSRHRMLVLDPHGERRGEGYLEAVYVSQGDRDTGVEIDLCANDNLNRYANQLAPFVGICGCDLRATGGDFSGTLLRLPLRTESQADKSKICERIYSDTEMRSLLRLAAEQADTLLLFTQTVRTLRFLHLSSNAANPASDAQVVFSVQKRPLNYFLKHSMPLSQLPLAGAAQADQEFAAQSSTLKVAEALLEEVAAETSTSPRPQRETRTHMSVEIELSVVESARGEFQLQVASATRTWLMCAAVGTGESLALARKQHQLGLSPVGAVALLLGQSQTLVPLSHESRPASLLFCFLPLPVENPFPVMLNASFSVTSSRRHLNEVTVDEKQGAWSLGEWNRALLTDVICPAYVDALRILTTVQLENPESFQQLWPLLESATQSVWRPLIQKFYNAVLDGQAPVFHTSAGWRSLSTAVFLDPNVSTLNDMSNCLTRLAKKLVGQNEGVASLTDGVRRTVNGLELMNKILPRQWSGETLLLNFVPKMARLWQSGDTGDCLKALTFILDVNGRGGNFDWDSSSQVATRRVLDSLKQNNSIPNTQNVLCLPSQLLDPHCLAGNLYNKTESVFPCQELQTPQRLQILRSIGLRVDLTWTEIMDRAQSIATLAEPQRLERMGLLLSYLESCNGKVRHPLHKLNTVSFLPAMCQPESACFAWHSGKYHATQLFQPGQLFGANNKDLVSATQLVLDDRVLCNISTSRHRDLLSAIGVQSAVSFATAWQQLLAISRCQGEATNDETLRVSQAVYRHLSWLINNRQLSTQEVERSVAQEPRIVWSLSGFLQPDQLTERQSDSEFPPYLHRLSRELTSSQNLPFLRAAGVLNQFTARQYAGVLQQLHQRYLTAALSPGDSRVSIKLLDVIALAYADNEQNATQLKLEEIFAPDNSDVLRPCSQLCFNNLPWMEAEPLDAGIYFCHKDIAYGLCAKLKIPSQRNSMLSQDFQPFQPFGQHEDLTTRLQNILVGYPLGNEIFKELIQNADDAGASKVWFVNDGRYYGTERVFSDTWPELQGPALIVYNDSTFSEADIEGIQSLGLGSKREDAWKTGQYGIGFNCVYNVTDVPSFLSDDQVLCVMDPHYKYMPNATRDSPGGMYKDVSRLKSVFTNVYEAYLPEHLQHSGGTVFRLPLRTQQAAVESKIRNVSVTPDDIQALFHDFKSELGSALPFLTSVREIRFCEVTSDGAFTTIYSVEAQIREISGSLEAFKQQCKAASKILVTPGAELGHLPASSVVYELTTVSSNTNAEREIITFLIQQKFGGSANSLPSELMNEVRSGKWRLLPKAGVAAQISPVLIPRISRSYQDSSNGRVYCLLPLPLTSPLPVFVNGHFVLDPSRRNLWKADAKEDSKEQWNNLLITQLLPDCYGSLMKVAITIFNSVDSIHQYYRLFPQLHSSDTSLWSELVKTFYREAFGKRWAIFPVLRPNGESLEWLPLAQSKSDVNGEAGFLTPHNIGTFLEKLLNSLKFPLIVADRICLMQSIDSCKLQFLPLADSQSIAAFLRGPVCDPLRASLPASVSETTFEKEESVVQLLVYLCSEIGNLQDLFGTPLSLTNGNRLLLLGQSQKLYLTEFFDLFQHCESRHAFAHSLLHKAFSDDQSHSRLTNTTGLFASFHIGDFVSILRREHPQICSGDKTFALEETCGMERENFETWLHRVWKFLWCKVNDSSQDELHQLNSSGVGDCHLIPVGPQPQRLFRVAYASCVYRSVSNVDDVSGRVQKALNHLKAPAVCVSNLSLVNTICGNVRKPESMLRVFEFALNENPARAGIDEKQAVDFLLYIQSNWKQLSESQGEQQLLSRIRKLPIFVTSDGRCCALNTDKACILPDSLVADEMETWKIESQAIYLRRNYSLNLLYQKLKCDEMKELEVYVNFILPAFSRLSDGTRERHLDRLRELSYTFDTIRFHDEAGLLERLQAALQKTDLIPAHGGWKTVDQFYDDDVELFKHTLEPDYFLPAPYNRNEWRNLMLCAGLVNVCTAKVAVLIAEKIASEGSRGPTDAVRKKSIMLLQFVDRGSFQERNDAVIRQLSSIAFVVTHQDANLCHLCDVNPIVMVTLNQCSLFDTRYLCWTVMPYAPDCVHRNSPCVKFMQPVDDESFLRHFANLLSSTTFTSSAIVARCRRRPKKKVCKTRKSLQVLLARPSTENMATLRLQVLQAIYARLAEMMLSGKSQLFAFLRDTPCIPVDWDGRTHFITANRITLDKDSAIPPYIFKCPEHFSTQKNLFIHLGATASATVEQIRYALEQIQSEQENFLTDSQQKCVAHCVSNMVVVLEHGAKLNIPSELNLYLPTRACSYDNCDKKAFILANCRELTINDSIGYQKRLIDSKNTRFIDLEFCKLGSDKLRRLYFHLAEDMKLPRLSSSVNEQLISDPNDLCEDGENCTMRCNLEAKLTHPVLHQCIVSILLNNQKDLSVKGAEKLTSVSSLISCFSVT